MIEVLSPDDRPGYVGERVAECLDAGAVEAWIVDPQQRSVTVHERGAQPLVLSDSDTIRGRTLLPGFKLVVANLFAHP